MNSYDSLLDVVKNDLCCGCGTCGAICHTNAIKFPLNSDGFYLPEFVESACTSCGACEKVCPNIKLDYFDNCSGSRAIAYSGYSNNDLIRQSSASGGLLTQLLCTLFEMSIIDGAYICSGNTLGEFRGSLVTSISELIQSNGSKYIQLPHNKDLLEITKSNCQKVVFVGLPCQIRGLELLRKKRSSLSKRIFATFSLMCGQVISSEAVARQLDLIGIKEKVDQYRFRGNGWPGSQLIKSHNAEIKIPYPSRLSMGGLFSSPAYMLPACLSCVDHLGKQSDITFLDAWHIKNTDNKGISSCLIWSELGKDIVMSIRNNSSITAWEDNLSEIIREQGHFFDNKNQSFFGTMLSSRSSQISAISTAKLSFFVKSRLRVFYWTMKLLSRYKHVLPWRAISFSRLLKRFMK